MNRPPEISDRLNLRPYDPDALAAAGIAVLEEYTSTVGWWGVNLVRVLCDACHYVRTLPNRPEWRSARTFVPGQPGTPDRWEHG